MATYEASFEKYDKHKQIEQHPQEATKPDQNPKQWRDNSLDMHLAVVGYY